MEIPTWSDELVYFTGTEQYHKIYEGVSLTDGVKFVADNAQAYWLIDLIWSLQVDPIVKGEGFQTYELKVNLAEQTGTVICTDGNDTLLKEIPLEYTTFPLASFKVYFIDGIVLLPSEY